MNVIEGQANLKKKFSLIFYSLTFNNILNIIVMVILAGIAISMAIGDSGVMTRAETANAAIEQKNIEETIQTSYYYDKDNAGKLDYDETKAAIEQNLTSAGYTAIELTGTGEGENETFPLTVTATGKTGIYSYTINQKGKVETIDKAENDEDENTPPSPDDEDETSDIWVDNGDGTYTKGKITLKIGDKVNYNELSNGVKEHSIDLLVNSMEQKCSTEDLRWRFLGINSDNQIELISEKLAKSNYLSFWPGNHGEKILEESNDIVNEFCELLYGKGEYAFSARCLNENDINKLVGIDNLSYNLECGTNWEYRYENDNVVYRNDINGEWSEWKSISKYDFDGESIFHFFKSDETISKDTPTKTASCTTDLYSANLSNISKTTRDGFNVSDLIASGIDGDDVYTDGRTSSQLLVSDIYEKGTQYGVQWYKLSILYGSMGCINPICTSYPDSWGRINTAGYQGYLRPIVILESDVNLEWNKELEQWEFKEQM